MPITPEESAGIIEAINQGTPINEIEAFKPVADKIVVHTTDGFQKFKENLTTETISSRTSQIYGDIDNELDGMGFEKIGNEEKTYDRIKRLGAAHKESQSTWEAEKSDLLKKIDDGAGLETIQNEFKAKEDAWKSKEQEYSKNIEGLQGQMVGQRKSIIVNSELSAFRKQFKDGLPESMVNTHVDLVVQDIVKHSKLSDDGKSLVMLNPDGSVKKNPVNFEPVLLNFELKSRLGDIIDEGRKQGGAGSEGGGKKETKKKDDGTTDIDNLEIPEEINTQVALDDYLQDVLKLEGTEFFEASQKHGRDKKLALR